MCKSSSEFLGKFPNERPKEILSTWAVIASFWQNPQTGLESDTCDTVVTVQTKTQKLKENLTG